MSIDLRDHIAALAMASLIQTNEDLSKINYLDDAPFGKSIKETRAKAAKVAYETADAMMAARGGNEGDSIYEKPGNLAL